MDWFYWFAGISSMLVPMTSNKWTRELLWTADPLPTWCESSPNISHWPYPSSLLPCGKESWTSKVDTLISKSSISRELAVNQHLDSSCNRVRVFQRATSILPPTITWSTHIGNRRNCTSCSSAWECAAHRELRITWVIVPLWTAASYGYITVYP